MTTITVDNIEEDEHGKKQSQPISASAKSTPSVPFTLMSLGAVVATSILMWFAYSDWIKPQIIHIQTGYVPFAGLVVVTAALERLLEPLSMLLLQPKTDETKKAAQSKAAAVKAGHDRTLKEAHVKSMVQTAANDQAKVDQNVSNRTVAFWVIASACGLGLSGGFGFFLLQSVANTNTHVNTFLDMVVTGLAIGAGTKPLHDLITNIQSKTSSSSTS
ncbi:MAG: hypothetical protein ACYDB2_07560 [Acidimicrobiales bacterium]